jgi:hypothetical protein
MPIEAFCALMLALLVLVVAWVELRCKDESIRLWRDATAAAAERIAWLDKRRPKS